MKFRSGASKIRPIAVLIVAAVVALGALYAYDSLAPKTVPVLLQSPDVIVVSPGLSVNYSTLELNPASTGGPATLVVSAPPGLTVGLSTSTVSASQPGPISVTLNASAGISPGNYTFSVQEQQSGGKQIQRFGVDVVPALVIILHERYNPNDLNVTKGTEVTWINLDSQIGCCDPGYHTVTFTSGANASSPILKRLDYWSYTFDDDGSYDYHCTIHLFMLGRVNVSS
ncbi:MAG TPA: plastocyanin/azurin family copper-binding protein [Nitrososphaerales archaeon]|nr:plastocyanin/azurin family copper-binding protein [Nitrososphaerales archaeon]